MDAVLPAIKPTESDTVTLDEYQVLVTSGDERLELSEGKLIHMSPVGEFHSSVVAEIVYLLKDHVRKNGGRAGTEVGVILSAEARTVRGPDVHYISPAKLTPQSSNFITTIPDLVVEVVSPGDTHSEVSAKVNQYLSSGVQLIWIVDPQVRQITVYASDNTIRNLSGEDTLTGGDVLPEFSVKVGQLFSVLDS